MRPFALIVAVLCVQAVVVAQPLTLEAPHLVVYRQGVEDRMRLFWNPVPGALAYDAFTCNASGGDVTVLCSVTDTTCLDSMLMDARYYRVQARAADTLSGLSNVAGYQRLRTGPGNTAFGLPFKFWMVPADGRPTYGLESTRPSSIIGPQLTCGTISTGGRITLQGGNYAYRVCTGTWSGTLESGSGMTPSKAYFVNNMEESPPSLVLAGDADTTSVGIPAVSIPAPAVDGAYTNIAYSWRDPRNLARERLNLLTSGFTGGEIATSDRVVEQAGSYFWYSPGDSAWHGMAGVRAGKAYFIVNKHVGHPWTYSYNASGQP